MSRTDATIRLACLVVLLIGQAAFGADEPTKTRLDYTQNCTTSGCHGTLISKRNTHAPLTDGACDACHETIAGKPHAFSMTEEDGELCLQCHDEFEGENIHAPVEGGACTACHDPHGSDHGGLLLTDTVGASCTTCHDDTLSDFKSLHGPVAIGACTACHNPHAADHASLLSAEGNALCTTCHDTLADRISASSHVHAPAAEDCLSCHNAHGGHDQFSLTTALPDLCLDCHEDIAEGTVTHAPVSTGRSCSNCHDPHAGSHESLLIKEPMTLCLGCHGPQAAGGNSAMMDLAGHLEQYPDHHGPIRDRDCSLCHAVHGSEHASLLVGSYPPTFYAPFEEDAYELCFACHESELVLEPETDEDTEFRNGTRNLHYVHVNQTGKGRTCRACHDVHASRGPHHVADSVPFGNWKIPINFRASETGGSCQPGCHKSYKYDRDAAAINFPPPPQSNSTTD